MPLHVMEWQHPHHGRIVETICGRHEGEVLVALRVLGIGGGARTAQPDEGDCTRCVNDGRPPRTFIPTLTGKPGLLD